ncbi:MAG: HAD family phosphatase [Candidatus Sumerlaeaceae bacterium]|nr:HAD family phosphatase [Candidatus Sumerlaeaceae bacterium]
MKFGVIFDNDGVLVDSEHISLIAYRQAIREQGVDLREEDDWQYCGLTDTDIIRAMREIYGADLDLDRFSSRKKELYFELAQREGLRPFPGVHELIADLKEHKISYAIASSGSLEKILFNLRSAGIEGLFPIIVSGEDFHRGKPDPEIFLCAAQWLGLAPTHCAIFEDSINGLKAARAADALAIGVTNTFPAEILAPYADILLSSLTDVSAAKIADWMRTHFLALAKTEY